MTKSILMGTDNHDGWKLEDLLSTLIEEIKAKSEKISEVDHPQRDMIIWHNRLIIANLGTAKTIQEETYRQMDALAPNEGPGKPRL